MTNRLTNSDVDKRLSGSEVRRIGSYKNAHERLKVKCRRCDHTWTPKAYSVLQTKTCPQCAEVRRLKGLKAAHAHRRLSDKEISKRLRPHNIKLVSTYTGNKDKLTVCCKTCNHEWSDKANLILSSLLCPNCKPKPPEQSSGKKRYGRNIKVGTRFPKKGRSLKDKFPQIARQFHKTKNGTLTAGDVFPFSDAIYWWKCPKGSDHEYDQSAKRRTLRGYGCPYCSGHRASMTNRLDLHYPEVAEQWHPTKNRNLKPDQFAYGNSTEVIWWKCPKGPDHEWEATIQQRTWHGSGCHCCSGDKVSVTNSLATLSPEIAKEWHPTKNKPLTPRKVTNGSSKKLWWRCAQDRNHEWPAQVTNRTGINRTGCPHCTLHPSSKSEVYLLFELKEFLRIDPEDHIVEINGALVDCDIVVRNKKIVVEYDGSRYHGTQKKRRSDIEKNRRLESAGWKVIRIREAPLKKIRRHDVIGKPRPFAPIVKSAVARVAKQAGVKSPKLNEYLKAKELVSKGKADEFIKELQSNTYPLPKRVTTDPEKVLTIDQVLKWCDQYFDKQGRYPGQTSESLRSMKEEKFVNIDAALRNGGRGLPAVGGLPGLLEREREHRHNKNTPNLNEETVVGWLITEYRATGSIRWPTAMDGTVYGHAEEKWSNLNACLHGGSRGFKKGGSIAQLKRRAMRRV
jgi:Zn finger protein HypA/HybF involved in hydrogenase expression